MASIMTSMPLFGESRPKVRMTLLSLKPSFALAWCVSRKATSGIPCGITSIFSDGTPIDGTEKLAPLLCHDDHFRRSIDDLAHHIALNRRRRREHGVKRRDDRHGKAGEQRDDMAAGFAAENSEFMLERNDVESCLIQELGGLDIIIDRLIVDLNMDVRRIVVAAAMIRHGDDTGFQIGASTSRSPDADRG